MQNPTMLYRFPGPHKLQDGSYDHIIVDDAEVEATLADGWFKTPAEAKDAASKPVELSAPTRAELEQKATELQIKFDGRTGDKKLADQIAAALEP